MNETEKYIKNTPLSYRKKMGQYFTSDDLIQIILNKIGGFSHEKILENSCGTGEFLVRLHEKFPDAELHACDIDPKMIEISSKRVASAQYECADYLSTKVNPEYDMVIGNPPYFEKRLTEGERNSFGDVVAGRANIYAMFIKHSVENLKEEGILAYVVPITMNSGEHFKKLREYLVKKTNIIYIETFESNKFKGAQQPVQILILQKRKKGTANDGAYLLKREGKIFFLPQDKKDQLENLYKGSCSLRDLGYQAKTGTLVWNQHKDSLTWDTNQTKLIWAHNIKDGKIVLFDHTNAPRQNVSKNKQIKILSRVIPLFSPAFVRKRKYQFIQTEKAVEKGASNKKAIVLNRVVGVGKNAKLRAALIDWDELWIAENHINIIFPIEEEEQIVSLEEVYNQLISARMTQAIRHSSCNSQLSQKDIELFLPFQKR